MDTAIGEVQRSETRCCRGASWSMKPVFFLCVISCVHCELFSMRLGHYVPHKRSCVVESTVRFSTFDTLQSSLLGIPGFVSRRESLAVYTIVTVLHSHFFFFISSKLRKSKSSGSGSVCTETKQKPTRLHWSGSPVDSRINVLAVGK